MKLQAANLSTETEILWGSNSEVFESQQLFWQKPVSENWPKNVNELIPCCLQKKGPNPQFQEARDWWSCFWGDLGIRNFSVFVANRWVDEKSLIALFSGESTPPWWNRRALVKPEAKRLRFPIFVGCWMFFSFSDFLPSKKWTKWDTGNKPQKVAVVASRNIYSIMLSFFGSKSIIPLLFFHHHGSWQDDASRHVEVRLLQSCIPAMLENLCFIAWLLIVPVVYTWQSWFGGQGKVRWANCGALAWSGKTSKGRQKKNGTSKDQLVPGETSFLGFNRFQNVARSVKLKTVFWRSGFRCGLKIMTSFFAQKTVFP